MVVSDENMNMKKIIIIVTLTFIFFISFLSRGLSDTTRFLLIALATFLALNIARFNNKK